MRISFDLDDTLFMNPDKCNVEPEFKFPMNILFKERLRSGTIELMEWIKERNIQLWIYTTSFRSERYIRSYFRRYGIKIDEVVNGERHSCEVQGEKIEAMPSKYPSRYHIDLHIDDDISVEQNGKIYGFKVMIIDPSDNDWVEKIKNRIGKLQNRCQD